MSKPITSRFDTFLAKIAGKHIDVSTLTPPTPINTTEELLSDIAERIDSDNIVVHFQYTVEDGVSADMSIRDVWKYLSDGHCVKGILSYNNVDMFLTASKVTIIGDGSLDGNVEFYGEATLSPDGLAIQIYGYYEADYEHWDIKFPYGDLDLMSGYDLVLDISGSLESKTATVSKERGNYSDIRAKLVNNIPVRIWAVLWAGNSRPQSLLVTGIQYVPSGGPGGSGDPEILIGLLQFGGLETVYAYDGEDPQTAQLKRTASLMDLSHFGVLAMSPLSTFSWK